MENQTEKKFFVVQINPQGLPTSLTAVKSTEEGLELLAKLAITNGVDTTSDVLSDDGGFYVETENREDYSGCWLIAQNN